MSGPRSDFSLPPSSLQFPTEGRRPLDSTGLESGIDVAMEEDEEQRALPDNIRRRRKHQIISKVTDETGVSVQQTFEAFLESFVEDPQYPDEKYYITQIYGLRMYELMNLYVDYSHLADFQNGVLAEAITTQYYRFLPFLIKGLHSLIKKYEPEYFASCIYGNSQNVPNSSSIEKSFAISFYGLPTVSRIRDCKTHAIGQLLAISGTVTRTSEVRPELAKATFTCDKCRAVVPNVEQSFRYTEPTQCPNELCMNKTAWRLDISQCSFTDWQKVRVQEDSSQIPSGSVPRIMEVILRGETVERAKAGDRCIFTGTLIVVPDVSQLGIPGGNPSSMRDQKADGRGSNSGVSGLKALGVRDLTYKLAFLACTVQSATERSSQTTVAPVENLAVNSENQQEILLNSMTQDEIQDLREMVHTDKIFSKLVKSIAPTIYGHDIVKKGVLLQLMGGVHKQTMEGINLRGDINVCILGDPSTAKSQFLKYVCSFLPRAIYTSGKASSAAGLTAAVVKDEESGEFTIEAGALMLADNGICAIDEFDKMDISDQVAIHEAMEQQTISIAKAGIQATLNARSSILAAANPIGGRYNRRTTLRNNINISAPIMSRFDLFFVILDEANESIDSKIAQHIVNTHRFQDESIETVFSTEQLQRYISYARTFKPKLTRESEQLLIEKYRELRLDDVQGYGRNSYRITVRQLESMIRLSEAIARAHCVEEITPAFVNEAYNLLRQSIIHVEMDEIVIDDDAQNLAGLDINPENRITEALDAALETSQDPTEKEVKQPKKITITYEKYHSILTMIVKKLEEDEQNQGKGILAADLVQWYLETEEDNIDSEARLNEETMLIKKVLKRLVQDSYLVPIISDQSIMEHDGAEVMEDQIFEQTIMTLHPNCSSETVSAT